MQRHTGCPGCSALTDAQVNAEDGVSRHNMHAYAVSIRTMLARGLHATNNGHWQGSVAYFDELIREAEGARLLAQANADGKIKRPRVGQEG
jgi:hypothetical protein